MPALLPVADARRMIVEGLARTEVEHVPLSRALARVLVEDAVARVSHPPADVSAMDGYAIRIEDVPSVPLTLEVVGESGAGHPWKGTLGIGQAVRVFTGAHIPAGANTVVMQENTKAHGTNGHAVVIAEMPQPARHIRPMGQDFKAGDVGLRAPRRLTARDIGFLAAMNIARVPVARRPRIGILSTGDEIVMPGEMPAEGQIVSANGPGLSAFVESRGGEAIHLGVAKDELQALRAAIARAEPLDMLVTSGGVSVGDHDLMRKALQSDDFRLAFHKIAMRPGKPLLFGRIGANQKLPVLGLPGNPVSAMVCAVLFLGPALDRMQGLAGHAPATVTATLGADLKENDSREDYLRAVLSDDLVATPFPKQDSGMVSSLALANALIVRPPGAPAAKAGTLVPAIPLDS
ncbi:MAG: gephyrin-like molybdotransferase Glp [Rhodospirillaceae bacterium]